MLGAGVLVLFLLPGLATYSALYGLFSPRRSIATQPPPANSIEAATLIVGAAAAAHAVATFLVATARAVFAAWGWTSPDPYAAALQAVSGHALDSTTLAVALEIFVVPMVIAFVATRFWLRQLAERDRVPEAIYGWAARFVNAMDDPSRSVVAYVVTRAQIGDRAIAYVGPLNDIKLTAEGGIARLTLLECDRYLINFEAAGAETSLGQPLSHLHFLVLEAAEIRNVAFEDLALPPEFAPFPLDD